MKPPRITAARQSETVTAKRAKLVLTGPCLHQTKAAGENGTLRARCGGTKGTTWPLPTKKKVMEAATSTLAGHGATSPPTGRPVAAAKTRRRQRLTAMKPQTRRAAAASLGPSPGTAVTPAWTRSLTKLAPARNAHPRRTPNWKTPGPQTQMKSTSITRRPRWIAGPATSDLQGKSSPLRMVKITSIKGRHSGLKSSHLNVSRATALYMIFRCGI